MARRPGGSRRRGSALVAVLAVVAAGLVASVSAPAQAATTSGPLHTANGRIYDAAGDPVRLVGFNWSGTEQGGRNDFQKAADGCGAIWRTPSDRLGNFTYDDMYQRLRDWGYNTIRLPISWNNLEPVAPTWNAAAGRYDHQWNQTYLNDLKQMVTKARAAGIMVILDMHQDYWSPALHRITNWDGSNGYCEGVGLPRWMYPSIDAKATTTQNTDFYNGMNWFFRNQHDPQVTTTNATPWQLLGAAWDKISYEFSSASGFAAHQAVVGADVFNEPYYSYVGGSPPAGQTVLEAAGNRLRTFYNAAAPYITAHNPQWLLFFQDGTGGYRAENPAWRETPTMTAAPSAPGQWVYSLHDYNFSYGTFSDGVQRHDDFGITVMTKALENARSWGVPLYIGEFTNFTMGIDARQLTPAQMAQTKLFLDWAEQNDVSWSFWAYVNGYRPMTFIDYDTNQPIAVVKDALETGLDAPPDPDPDPDPDPGGQVADTFTRTVSGGWGNADTGGAWTVGGGNAAFAVSGGTGRIATAVGSSRTAALTDVNLTDTDLRTTVGLDTAVTGGGLYAAVLGRRVSSSADYRLKLRSQPNGVVTAQLVRVVGGAETAVQTVATVPGLTWNSGSALKARLQVAGTSPTTLRAKVWRSGTTEPSDWLMQTTDATAGLQVAGGVGFWTYLSGTATAPVTVTFDDLTVGGEAPPPPPNVPPVAAFTSSCTNLQCSFDGRGSTDSDGTVTGWAWTFGDGATGTGSTTTRTYATAGTHTVRLTVTDDDGATHERTGSVTVTAPPDPGALFASDDFTRSTAGGWGSADAGGTWTTSSATSTLATNGTTGRISLTAGSGPSVFLTAPSVTSSDVRVFTTLDKPATGGGVYVSVFARRVVGQGDYRAKVRMIAGGQVSIQLLRVTSAGQENAIGNAVTVPGLTFAPQTGLRIRVQATGTSPTTVRAKVWADGASEPGTWTVSGTDATAGMQTAGGLGLMGYLSGTATNAPVAVVFDELRAGPA